MMKNKYKILLFLISITFLYFLYSNRKVNGVWIEIYQFSNENGIIQFSPISSRILEMKNGKLTFHYFTEETDKYFLLNNKFHYSKHFKNSEIKTLNKDSMVVSFKSDMNKNSFMVYKRIPDKYKSQENFELLNKIIISKKENLIDTVYFDKEFIIHKTKGKWNYLGNLKINNIGGFNILQTYNGIILISKSNKGKNFLYTIPKNLNENFLEIEIKEINENKKEINILLDKLRNDNNYKFSK